MPDVTTRAQWTSRELIRWMSGHFTERGIDSPRVCAEMLLSHVLDCERMTLYMEADRPATAQELASLRALVTRAAKHEPVQYLVGHAWFFSRRFDVDGSTLIPRPSTETLVEEAIQHCRTRALDAPQALDLCTGSGCVAISIAAQIAGARVIATDVVSEALALAQRNAAAHAVADRVDFRAGSLWEPLRADERFDLIAANPPYISDVEWAEVPPNVRNFEPEGALRGGADGLRFVREIIQGAPSRLAPTGLLLVEIAASQEAAALEIARSVALREVRVLRDYEGLPRVLAAVGE